VVAGFWPIPSRRIIPAMEFLISFSNDPSVRPLERLSIRLREIIRFGLQVLAVKFSFKARESLASGRSESAQVRPASSDREPMLVEQCKADIALGFDVLVTVENIGTLDIPYNSTK
jgi:hypothetical protein